MLGYRDTAAVALAEPGWLRLGLHYAMFCRRRGEKPRKRRRGSERDVIDDDAFTQIMAGAGVLGVPAAEGGSATSRPRASSFCWPAPRMIATSSSSTKMVSCAPSILVCW